MIGVLLTLLASGLLSIVIGVALAEVAPAMGLFMRGFGVSMVVFVFLHSITA